MSGLKLHPVSLDHIPLKKPATSAKKPSSNPTVPTQPNRPPSSAANRNSNRSQREVLEEKFKEEYKASLEQKGEEATTQNLFWLLDLESTAAHLFGKVA